MSQRLPVPPELEHLIEKREAETGRRAPDKRTGKDRRQIDLGPLGAIESAGSLDDVPTTDRRTGKKRRTKPERRGKKRRKAD